MEGGAPGRVRLGEVMRYLGYAGQEVDEGLRSRIALTAARCDAEQDPRWTWLPFPVRPLPEDEGPGYEAAGAALKLRGRSMAAYLSGASHAAVLACTLGAASERALRLLGATDPVGQLVYDAACTDLVEWGADRACDEIRAWAAGRGLAPGERFSPGYGDLPLDTQPALLQVLSAGKRIGVAATSDFLLVPSKSVTAVVGLYPSDPGPSALLGCGACGLRDTCQLRLRGATCLRGAGDEGR